MGHLFLDNSRLVGCNRNGNIIDLLLSGASIGMAASLARRVLSLHDHAVLPCVTLPIIDLQLLLAT